PALAREEDVERLRRGDEDVRRLPRHGCALARRRVTGPDEHADRGERRIARLELAERRVEVLLHVVSERLERGDVEDERPVRKRGTLPEEAVQGPQEGSQGL